MAFELFTNKKKTEDEEVEISAPAFSVTKVASALGVVVAGLLAAVPSSVKDHDPIVIASIASATVIVLGIFVLVAIDIRVRQRAQEAKRRWPSPEEKAAAKKKAEPDSKEINLENLTIQVGGNGQEASAPSNPASPASKSSGRVIKVDPGQTVSVVLSDPPS